MPPTVLLTNTNWWPVSAHVAIALQGAGIRVAAAYPKHGHPLAKTSAVSARYPYNATSPLQSLTRAIRESRADWILPCDDRTVRHLQQLHGRSIAEGSSDKVIADLIERSLGSPSAFSVVSSRAALLRTAQAEGVPIPDMVEVETVEDLRSLSESKPFPWVMKVDGSWGGLGVKVVRNREEADACFQRMRAPLGVLPMLKRLVVNRDPFWIEDWRKPAILGVTVQSHIQGRPANCVVFCCKGKVLAGIAVEVVAAQGVMAPATIVRIVDGRNMLDAARSLANRLNLSGFHGLDFMLEDATGTAFLIELNPRCAMPCHLRLASGRDLAGSLAAELAGQPFAQPAAVASDTVAYFPQAWLSNPKSEVFRTGYHDVPWGEPELLKELLLLPFPDRSLLARLSDRMRKLSFEDRSARSFVFASSQSASTSASPQGQPREVA